MLRKIEMTEKIANTLSAAAKPNRTLDKYTEDVGDLAFYTSTDGKTRYLRVWVMDATQPKEGPHKGHAEFFVVEPGIGQTRTPLDTK